APLSRCSFFFQAEDGIRDFHVTGVQTCALPIFTAAQPATRSWIYSRPLWAFTYATVLHACAHWFIRGLAKIVPHGLASLLQATRSEERRVGKECRCRRVTCPE